MDPPADVGLGSHEKAPKVEPTEALECADYQEVELHDIVKCNADEDDDWPVFLLFAGAAVG